MYTSTYPFALPNNTLRCQTLLPTRGPIFSSGSPTDRGANSLLCFFTSCHSGAKKWAGGELDTNFSCNFSCVCACKISWYVSLNHTSVVVGRIFVFLKGKHTPMCMCVGFVLACVWWIPCGRIAESHTCRLKGNTALSFRAKFICSLLL